MLMKKKERSRDKFMIFKQENTKPDKLITIALLVSFFIVFCMIIISNHYSIFTKFRLSGYEVGKVAPRDLIADHNYSYIDTQASENKIINELSKIYPIFEMDNEKSKSVLNDFSLFSQVYLHYKDSPSEESRLELVSSIDSFFNREEIRYLLNDVEPFQVITLASGILEDILQTGIFEYSDNINNKDPMKIQLWQWERGQRNYSIINLVDTITLEDINSIIDTKLLLINILDTEKYAVKLIVSAYAKENIFFNELQTQLRFDEIRKKIEPVMEEIYSGDYIIRRGFIVSEDDFKKAAVLNTQEKKINILQIISDFLFLLLICSFSILMFKPIFCGKKRKYQYIYLLLSFYILFIFYTSIILQFNFTIGYNLSLFLPTALISMMLVILIGFNESILMIIILSVSLFLFPSVTIPDFIFSFTTGLSAAFLMKSVKKRIDLVKPALFLAVINISVLLFGFSHSFNINWIIVVISLATLNAFISSILNLTLIPVFEHFLNIPTVFRLMELSDMNSPLFRKMVTMAPGTYGHSMAVANLADAACRDIGANPLLARVGAYYHDIGKLDKPEYFIENQTEANKHDLLNPSLSVAVIKSHVKVGVEKAKELGLPFEIIDIISQHHGSGLIGYFYREAMNKEGSNKKILSKDFSYTGIPPESKEAAVVMLADTVEAASRVLKKPTIIKLEKFIWKLIMEKIERGQMSNTSLTMNDLLIIKMSFVNILSGYFHTRIEYPKIKRKNQ